MNGEIGVSHILRNDATVSGLVGTKVYLDKPPQPQALPFIIVEVKNISPIISKDGKAEKDIDTIEVVLIASSRIQLKNIFEAVREALDHIADGTHNGISIEQIVFQNASFSHEDETNRDIYTANMEFELWVRL